MDADGVYDGRSLMVAFNMPNPPSRRRLKLGQIVATPGALEAFTSSEQGPMEFLNRHIKGDWGEVDAEDWQANDRAVVEGTRIISAYRTKTGDKLWVITESDRSATTLLLPSEY